MADHLSPTADVSPAATAPRVPTDRVPTARVPTDPSGMPGDSSDEDEEFANQLAMELEKNNEDSAVAHNQQQPEEINDDSMIEKLEQLPDDPRQHGIAIADFLVKLSFMVGFDGVGSQQSSAFNNMLCMMIVADDYEDDTSEATVFRDFVSEVKRVLEPAVKCENGVPLTYAGMDVLRTAHYRCSSANGNPALYEYNTVGRDDNNMYKNMGNALRGYQTDDKKREITDEESYSHYIGSQTSEMLDAGLEELGKLIKMGDREIMDLLRYSYTVDDTQMQCCPHHVRGAFVSMAIPAMFDGQRLRTGVDIMAHVFGPVDDFYGEGNVDKVLNTSGCLYALSRAQIMTVAFVEMARTCMEKKFVDRAGSEFESELAARQAVRMSDEWKETHRFFVDVKDAVWERKNAEKAGKTDSVGGITLIYNKIANWVDDALAGDDASLRFRILKSVLDAEVFTFGKAGDAVEEAWKTFVEEHGRNVFSFWEMVDFVYQARDIVENKSMSVSSAMAVVLGGAIAEMMPGSGIDGLVVFTPYFIDKVAKLTTCHFPDRSSAPSPSKEKGKTCGPTKVLRALAKATATDEDEPPKMRKPQVKGKLQEARLRACFHMMSMQEAMMRDLPEEACSLPGENRKDIRRLYVCGLQSLPCLKHSSIRHEDDKGSYLIERGSGKKRKRGSTDDGKTTKDNVEKPWRDVLGGSIISLLFFSIVQEAYIAVVQELMKEEEWSMFTYQATNLVLEKMEELCDVKYFTEDALEDKSARIANREDAHLMLKQQNCLLKEFCKLAKNQGMLWEGLCLTFSVSDSPSSDDEDIWE